jgi:hypothetical protein
MTKLSAATICIGACLSFAPPCLAQSLDETVERRVSTIDAASAGETSVIAWSAAIVPEHALVTTSGGYDTARSSALFDTTTEVRVWGPIALRASATFSEDTQRMRPSLGLRWQFQRQHGSGIDGSVSSVFKTEGFDETEGEIETTLAIGHRFDRWYLLGNVAYGQDPEGRERDGEVRFSLLRSSAKATVGFEARARSAIGAQTAPNSSIEPRADMVDGVLLLVPVGPVVAFAEAGPDVVKLPASNARWGVASVCGVASVF